MKLQIKNQFDCVSENYNEWTNVHIHTHCTSSFIIVMICAALCENLHISKTDGTNNSLLFSLSLSISLFISTVRVVPQRALCFCEQLTKTQNICYFCFIFDCGNFLRDLILNVKSRNSMQRASASIVTGRLDEYVCLYPSN